jgi:Cu+-exporting ATPase
MLLSKKVVSAQVICTHCGDDCEDEPIIFHEKAFCCQGCKTIFELFTENGLDDYYLLNKTPGISPNKNTERFSFLDNEQLIERLSDYKDEDNLRITLEIPSIHCSSCIWLLENLHRLDDGVRYCHVNFGKRELSLLLDTKKTSLRTNIELLSQIGYEPSIRLDKLDKKATKKSDYSRWYKIGIAGFCFGNIMLLTLPEYFDPSLAFDRSYSVFFRVMNIVLSLPALLYVSPEYFISAWKSIRAKVWNIDVPIALGIAVIFLRSLFEIITDAGPGYLDSLCGLVFFMSIGRTFQKITYDGLNFDRDYTSYFPVSVEVSVNGKDEYVPITQLKVGQVIRLRNGEICPGDATLLSIKSVFDSSFVTGESKAVEKAYGSKIFAGLKNIGVSAELRIEKDISQSYLTDLWNNKAYQKQTSDIQSLTDKLSHYFTPAIIAIAIVSFSVYVLQGNWATAWNALTAVLIVACPCALALASPFAMGNALRILGKHHFFVKNAISLETLASINHIVFDKTGTLTQNGKEDIEWQGRPLSIIEQEMSASLLKQSGHPLSRGIYSYLETPGNLSIQNFEEREGKGIYGEINGHRLWIGSQSWCDMVPKPNYQEGTSVWIRMDDEVVGVFNFNNRYRKDLAETIGQFNQDVSFSILSGDNPSEKARLEMLFPTYTRYRFQSLPDEKSTYINGLKTLGYKVAMVGDGLNDSGALMSADMGISISDNLNTFSPASDAILDGKYFSALPKFIQFAKKTRNVVKLGFIISLLYNCIGLYLAVTGNLSPVLAAILMPLSSITVICFVTVTLNILARRMKF